MTDLLKGECLCGAVRFSGVPNEGEGIGICHCGQCRRWTAGPFMEVNMFGTVTFEADETLVWYRSSDIGERGFCSRCGTSLFWRKASKPEDISVSVGALQEDHGMALERHIWVDDQPCWYTFADDTPRLTAAQAMGQTDD